MLCTCLNTNHLDEEVEEMYDNEELLRLGNGNDYLIALEDFNQGSKLVVVHTLVKVITNK